MILRRARHERARKERILYENVGDGHSLFVAVSGSLNAEGDNAAVFLHGGPGGASSPRHVGLFPPGAMVARFDQRGCGKSKSLNGLKENNTDKLVADMEAIRLRLEVDKWLLCGGSWGSTLALAYATRHPQRVSGLALRAVFLGEDEEWERAFSILPRLFRPQLAAKIAAHGGAAQLEKRVLKGDETAAKIWGAYERSLATLEPLPLKLSRKVPNSPLLECHYHKRKFFLKPGELLKKAHRLADIPGVIVQGAYDLICPPLSSHKLAKAWGKRCDLRSVSAGHDVFEPAIAEELKKALRSLLP